MAEDNTGPPSGRRVSVDEAARALGLTVDAVRKRVQRGTIEHEKDGAGRVRIVLDSPDDASTLQDESPDTSGAGRALIAAKDETIEELRARVRRLEHELDTRNEEIRRRNHLLAAALERIPELEAPSEAPEDSETVEEAPERAQSPGPTLQARRRPHGGPGGGGCSGGSGEGDPPLRYYPVRVKGPDDRQKTQQGRTGTWAGAAEADGGIPRDPAGAVGGKDAARKAARIAAGGVRVERTGRGWTRAWTGWTSAWTGWRSAWSGWRNVWSGARGARGGGVSSAGERRW